MAGATRTCPHCRTTILESATVCPSCRHHVRFGAGGRAAAPRHADFIPLRVDGTVRHPGDAPPWEYSVVVTIRNGKGEEVTRQVVGVGGLGSGEERTFSLSVEVFTRG